MHLVLGVTERKTAETWKKIIEQYKELLEDNIAILLSDHVDTYITMMDIL